MKVEATARVRITLEVDASMWGGECQIDQLYRQAAKTGLANVSKAISDGAALNDSNIRVVGKPEVIGVLTERP